MAALLKIDESVLERIRSNDDSLVELNLSKRKLNDDDAESLAAALQTNSTIRVLDLSTNSISDRGVASIARSLVNNNKLEVLALGTNDIGPEGTAVLAETLKKNYTLKFIDFYYNIVGDDGAASLASALIENPRCALEKLDLCGNSVGTPGIEAISTALKINSSLKEINLDGNNVDMEGATHLAAGLRVNVGLERLLISNNEIGEAGAMALIETVKTTNISLSFIDVSGNKLVNPVRQEVKSAIGHPDREEKRVKFNAALILRLVAAGYLTISKAPLSEPEKEVATEVLEAKISFLQSSQLLDVIAKYVFF